MLIDHVFEIEGTKLIRYHGKSSIVAIPNIVTEVGDHAFEHAKVTSLCFGPNIKQFGRCVFGYCENEVNTIVFSGTVQEWLEISFLSHFSKNNDLIINNQLITNIIIPEDISTISDYAFYGCKNITSIQLHKSIHTIGHFAFSYCKQLKQVNIEPDNPRYQSLKEGVLDKDNNTLIWGAPSSWFIPFLCNKIENIGIGAFAGCEWLENADLTRIKTIERDAFADCVNLKYVDYSICSSVATVRTNTFAGCLNLRKLVLPLSLKKIERYAFFNCKSLEEIDLPEGVIELEDHSFDGCRLNRLTIPKSLDFLSFCDECPFDELFIKDLCYRGSEKDWHNTEFYCEITDEQLTFDDIFFYEKIYFNHISCTKINLNTPADLKEVFFKGKFAEIEDLIVTFDWSGLSCLRFIISNNSNRNINVHLKSICNITPSGMSDLLANLSSKVDVNSKGERTFMSAIKSSDFRATYLVPYFLSHNPFLPTLCTSKLGFTVCFSIDNQPIEECEIILDSSCFLIFGDYNSFDEKNFTIKKQAASVPVCKKQNILYIYKGNIRCNRNCHHVIQATAILHNATDDELELNVEYCMDCKKYILNYTLFEEYRNQYGVLIGNFRMVTNGEFIGEYDLAEESPLRLSGYNVNQKDNLSSKERHYILARIIHDNIMPKGDVIRYLSYFIRKNGAKQCNRIALSKWKEDLAFVQKYDINTQPKAIISEIRPY